MNKLQTIRKERGITQQKLSELSGVPLKTIQGYEGTKDINKAQVMIVYKLAHALNINIEDLLEI